MDVDNLITYQMRLQTDFAAGITWMDTIVVALGIRIISKKHPIDISSILTELTSNLVLFLLE